MVGSTLETLIGLDVDALLLAPSDEVAVGTSECVNDGFDVAERFDIRVSVDAEDMFVQPAVDVDKTGTAGGDTVMLGLDIGVETTVDASVWLGGVEDAAGTAVGVDVCFDGTAPYFGLRMKSSEVSSSKTRLKELLSTAESLSKVSETFSGFKWVVSLTLSAMTEI